MNSADLYYRHDSHVGEGPVWIDGTLYWTDITNKAIYAKCDDQAEAKKYSVGVEVGAFVPWVEQRFVIAGGAGFESYDMATGNRTAWTNPEQSLPENRFNDGKCDPRGRFVAGTLNRSNTPGAGALYVLDHDRSVRELLRGVTCSNGLAWSEDGGTFYYIDTPTFVVRAFDYDLETARLSNERVVIELPKNRGYPDGTAIDRDGNLWIALWGGWAVECWNPRTGRSVERIDVPVACAASCAFGGPNLDILYITTARYDLDEAGLAKQPLAGSVFCARPGVTGYPVARFLGREL